VEFDVYSQTRIRALYSLPMATALHTTALLIPTRCIRTKIPAQRLVLLTVNSEMAVTAHAVDCIVPHLEGIAPSSSSNIRLIWDWHKHRLSSSLHLHSPLTQLTFIDLRSLLSRDVACLNTTTFVALLVQLHPFLCLKRASVASTNSTDPVDPPVYCSAPRKLPSR
jgi:hypothetical protein